MQTITIDKKAWAVGFLWQAPDSAKKLTKMARQKAKQLSVELEREYNAIVVRTRGQVQIGFGECEVHPVPQMPSLATALAQAKSGTWLGRFVLPEGIYVIGVMEGTILAEGDFLGTEGEANDRISDLDQLIGMGGEDQWDEIFRPENEEDSLTKLQELLQQAGKVPKVQSVEVHIPVKRIALIGGLLTLALVGHGLYSSYQEKQAELQRALELKTTQQELERQAELAARKALGAVSKPWQESPLPSGTLSSCLAPYSGLKTYSRGWILSEWNCGSNGGRTLWVRTDQGSFSTLPGKAVLRLDDPKTAEETYILKVMPARGEQALILQEPASRKVFEIARRLRCRIGVRWEIEQSTPSASPPVSGKGKGPMPPSYRKATWQMSDLKQFPTRDLIALLDSIPGLTVSKVRYSEKNQWTLEGDLYASK